MNKRKWTIWLCATLLVVMTVSGYFAIAAEYGSKEDPLVTLSYIEDVLSPKTMQAIEDAYAQVQKNFESQIDGKLAAATADMDKLVDQYKSTLGTGTVSDEVIDAIAEQVIARMQEGGITGGGGTTAENSWEVLSLGAGKTLIGNVGCEIILRIGTATCTASASPGLINLTAGNELASGGALAANQLYIVTVNSASNTRGIQAGGEGCTVLVNGGYTIS